MSADGGAVVPSTPEAERLVNSGPQVRSRAWDVEGTTIPNPALDRIKRRLEGIKRDLSDLWLAVASAFFGVGVAALIAVLTLPRASAQKTGISPSTHDVLVTIAIMGGLVFVGFLAVYFVTRKGPQDECADIKDEIEVHGMESQPIGDQR